MLFRFASVSCLLMVVGCAAAPAPASTDPNAVSSAEIQSMISGRSVRFGSDTATYAANGRYTYKGGNPGTYSVNTGMICVNFDDGHRRCDQILRSGKSVVFVTESGDRVPFKPI